MAQSPLITPAILARYAAGSDFLDAFEVKALSLVITTTGALGTMAFTWQVVGDVYASAPIVSEAGAPWTKALPDPAWCSLAFAAGTYTSGQTFTVSRTGTVTGPSSLITATRTNIAEDMCAEVTSEGVTRMQPRVVPPVLVAGVGVEGALARIVIYRLKSRSGLTPQDAGAGDDNIRVLAERAEKFLDSIGRSAQRPPDLVDSSTGGGAGIPQMPVSRSSRGFGNF